MRNRNSFDVVVDIDPSSKNFKIFLIELSDQNLKMLWVPAGYAHGFCVLSDFADFHYKCTDYYDANDQHGLIWNDKNIGIEWPIIEPIVSEKDLNLPTVSSFFLKYEDNNFGASGQLGLELQNAFNETSFNIHSFSKKDVDITDSVAVKKILKEINPDVVINCAAYTKVDDAEVYKSIAKMVNFQGTKNNSIQCRSKKNNSNTHLY